MRTPEETLAALDEIEARTKSTTPGNWVLCVGNAYQGTSGAWEIRNGNDGALVAARNAWPHRQAESEANARLFLHARNDVPDLVALVRQLVAERDEARTQARGAEASERALRDEVGAALRKHGLAPGPEAIDGLVRERDAYKRAKAENDERFQLERDEARHECDQALSALRDVLPYAESRAEDMQEEADELRDAYKNAGYPPTGHQDADGAPLWKRARREANAATAAVDAAKRLLGIEAHERSLSQSNEPEISTRHTPKRRTNHECLAAD